MTQEVRVMLQLTLDVDTKLNNESISKCLEFYLNTIPKETGIDVQMVDIVEIREEAEIYGTEEDEYHISPRQMKIDFNKNETI